MEPHTDEPNSPSAAARDTSPEPMQDSPSSEAVDDTSSTATQTASQHTSLSPNQDSSPPPSLKERPRGKHIPPKHILPRLAFAFSIILVLGVHALADAVSKDRISELLGDVSTKPLPEVSAYIDQDGGWEVSTPRGIYNAFAGAWGTYDSAILTVAGLLVILEEGSADDMPDRIVQFDSNGEFLWSRTINVPVFTPDYRKSVSYSQINGSVQATGDYLVLHTACTRKLDGTMSTPVVVLEAATGETVLETKVSGAVVSMVLLSDAVVVQTTDGTTPLPGGTITILPFDGSEATSWETDEWLASTAGDDLILSDFYSDDYNFVNDKLDLHRAHGSASVRTVHRDGSDARGPWHNVTWIGADGTLTIGNAPGERTIIDARTGQQEAEQ
ncbi:hypothetical protein [Actinobaculum sp. 352]|uniref:hypothetical protein n=1 Tax=Actinobaculum sp. 352 TaxID=2490946 RepID=UPI000F7D7E93|nr:hypothetical protein [Actinobaculum sp. 352]RTE49193.1 hypothetical protein EKN07_06345 [Actinobaculum sp. 352]